MGVCVSIQIEKSLREIKSEGSFVQIEIYEEIIVIGNHEFLSVRTFHGEQDVGR